MSDFPHEAIITPVLSESMHEAFARCIICQEVPDIVYQVDIPPKWIDDETIRHPVSTTCCSEQHALEYLQKKEPRTRKKDRRFPSEAMDTGWIDVYRKYGDYPDDNPTRDGKWLIWLSPANIDRYWKLIRAAVELGKLGNRAKVSTAGSLSEKRPGHVICVYTYDFEDREDVMRIREVLRKIGIKQKIRYKSNEDTLKLQYGSNYTPKYEV